MYNNRMPKNVLICHETL